MKPFYERLRNYFEAVAAVLRGEAEAASVFPNPTDVGEQRERVYLDFLRTHLPRSAHVLQGGFLFDLQGNESKQIDVIAVNNYNLRFDFLGRGQSPKAFACVEGSIAAASLKSNLTGEEFEEAFLNLASIPPMGSLEGRISIFLRLDHYDNWPFKIIYAARGVAAETIFERYQSIIAKHPEIPPSRWPDLVHVAGSYAIIKSPNPLSDQNGIEYPSNTPQLIRGQYADIQGMLWAVLEVQKFAMASSRITFNYDELLWGIARAGY